MKYTVNDLKKNLGINPETTRHYRNIGLIMPEKDPDNGYYYYSDWDAFQLLFIRRYRNMNFSIDDVQAIKDGVSTEDQLMSLKNRAEELERQIEALSIDLDHTRQICQYLEMTIRKQGTVEIINWEDDFYALYLLGKGCRKPKQILLLEWIRMMPYTYPTISIPADQLNDFERTEPYDVQIGLACVDRVRKQKKIPIDDSVERIRGSLSVRTFITLDNPFDIRPYDIRAMLDYVREHNYRFAQHSTGWIMINDYSSGQMKCMVILRVAIC